MKTIHEIRAPVDDDWSRIDYLASNDVQEADHAGVDQVWTNNRRAFSGERHHVVLTEEDVIQAYCSLERNNGETSWRAFIVMDWSVQDEGRQQAAFGALEQLMEACDAREVWMRELTGDRLLLSFIQSKGFFVERTFEHEGQEMMVLRLHRSDPASRSC